MNPFPGGPDFWECCSLWPTDFLGVLGLTRSCHDGLRLKTRGSCKCRGEVQCKATSHGVRMRCSSKVLPQSGVKVIPSISGLALAEISKPNLKKHYHNCMFTEKRKNNQMKKDKTSTEKKNLFPSIYESATNNRD